MGLSRGGLSRGGALKRGEAHPWHERCVEGAWTRNVKGMRNLEMINPNSTVGYLGKSVNSATASSLA